MQLGLHQAQPIGLYVCVPKAAAGLPTPTAELSINPKQLTEPNYRPAHTLAHIRPIRRLGPINAQIPQHPNTAPQALRTLTHHACQKINPILFSLGLVR